MSSSLRGALLDGPTGRLTIYYGGADTVVCLAHGYLPEIIEFIKTRADRAPWQGAVAELGGPAFVGGRRSRRRIIEFVSVDTPMQSDLPISELFAQGRPLRSLEFFPPKDEAGVEALRQTAAALQRIGPDFVSVTYGAGGSTQERTAQVSSLLRHEFGFTVMPHLTAVTHTRAEVAAVAEAHYARGSATSWPCGATCPTACPRRLRSRTTCALAAMSSPC